MIKIKAAALIHSRTAYCDFRSNFLAHPVDMSQFKIDELKKFVLQTTQSIEDLYDEGIIRRIVYADDNYVVLGITGYMKDIIGNYLENMDKTILTEERGRPIFAFVGLVFRKADCRNITSFPNVESFILSVERYLVPRWNERIYSDNANNATLTDYDISVVFDDLKHSEYYDLNVSGYDKVKVFNTKESNDIILASIIAAANGKRISACTNFSYKSDAENSYFMNVTCKSVSNSMISSNALAPSSSHQQKSNDKANGYYNQMNSIPLNSNTNKYDTRYYDADSSNPQKKHTNGRKIAIVITIPESKIINRIIDSIQGLLTREKIKYDIIEDIDESNDNIEKSQKVLLNEQIKKNLKTNKIPYNKDNDDFFK